MESNYIIGAHNSWSFLPVRKWWMKPFSFMAKCQRVDIKTQYLMHYAKCFDLRLFFDKDDNLVIKHGIAEYKYTEEQLLKDLTFLNNRPSQCYVRVIHEVRSEKKYTDHETETFQMFCERIEKEFPNIRFWCGRNLVNWEVDYKFKNNPTCDEKYSSVCPPKLIDDWIPLLYAKLNNKKIRKEGTDKDILLIDFVDLY